MTTVLLKRQAGTTSGLLFSSWLEQQELAIHVLTKDFQIYPITKFASTPQCLDMISEAAGSGDSQLSGAASYDNEQTCRDLTQEAISRREISSVLLGNRFLGFWT